MAKRKREKPKGKIISEVENQNANEKIKSGKTKAERPKAFLKKSCIGVSSQKYSYAFRAYSCL